MMHLEGTFSGAQGWPLYYQHWSALPSPKAIVTLIHGLGSHSGGFAPVVQPLVTLGYGVYAWDLRGHGRSPGQRGYIQTWAEFRQDFEQFHQFITQHHPHLPIYGLGHSLGAIILLDYALHSPHALAGLIAMAPALQPQGVPPLRLAIGQCLSWIWPRFSLDTGLPPTGSRDAAMVLANAQDPLRHRRGTARLATEFLQTTAWIQTHIAELQVPILILHGSDDRVARCTGSQLLFDRIENSNKEYRYYPCADHDLHQDLDAEQVIADMTAWLDRQLNHDMAYCRLNYQIIYKTCLR